jgi:ABC-type lipopolysaccharide export system ATPase subunit
MRRALSDNISRLASAGSIKFKNTELTKMPEHQRVRLGIEAIDYLTLELSCRHLETLADDVPPVGDDESAAAGGAP